MYKARAGSGWMEVGEMCPGITTYRGFLTTTVCGLEHIVLKVDKNGHRIREEEEVKGPTIERIVEEREVFKEEDTSKEGGAKKEDIKKLETNKEENVKEEDITINSTKYDDAVAKLQNALENVLHVTVAQQTSVHSIHDEVISENTSEASKLIKERDNKKEIIEQTKSLTKFNISSAAKTGGDILDQNNINDTSNKYSPEFNNKTNPVHFNPKHIIQTSLTYQDGKKENEEAPLTDRSVTDETITELAEAEHVENDKEQLLENDKIVNPKDDMDLLNEKAMEQAVVEELGLQE